jgi:NitT/TauT family transport system substrate-binding protein
MKRIVAITAAALLLAAQTVFAKGSAEKSAYPLGEWDLEYAGSTCGSPTSIGVLKGFFEEEGVKITLVSGNKFSDTQAALSSGKLPVTNGDFQFFPSVHNGIDVKLIGGLHEGCIKILVPENSSIRTLADLRGKRIAVDEIGGTPMSVASVAAGSAGIDPQRDITFIPYPNDQIFQAVLKGEADVGAAWDPFATTVELGGGWRVLVDISEHPLFADKACCFLFASNKLVKEKPEVIAAILRGYQKAVAWIGAHPREAAELLIKEKKIATDDVALVTGLLEHYRYDRHSGSAANARAKEDAVYFARELTKIGYLPANLDPQKFVDDLYVDIFALEAAAKK